MRCLPVLLLTLSLIFANSAFAASIHWSGPPIGFASPGGAIPAVDPITPGVGLTRTGPSAPFTGAGGLFNIVTEPGGYTPFSGHPGGTLWTVSGIGHPGFAFGGPLAAAGAAAAMGVGYVFTDWATAYGGGGGAMGGTGTNIASNILTPAILKIPGAMASLDIYIDIVFGTWTSGPGATGAFSYMRSTPIPVPAALPLFLSAVAGLGFVAKRKRV